jgi:hypothetical protein
MSQRIGAEIKGEWTNVDDPCPERPSTAICEIFIPIKHFTY